MDQDCLEKLVWMILLGIFLLGLLGSILGVCLGAGFIYLSAQETSGAAHASNVKWTTLFIILPSLLVGISSVILSIIALYILARRKN